MDLEENLCQVSMEVVDNLLVMVSKEEHRVGQACLF